MRARNAEHGVDDLHELPAGRYVLITVADDGHGSHAEMALRVFEPFFTTKTVGKGTGLSLSQVHGLCTQAGGTARLASTPGVGTTVPLLLPAASNSGPVAPAPAGAANPAVAQTALSIAGPRILLVEDNDALATVTAALLGSHGACVQRAADPAEALACIAAQPAFDVLLSGHLLLVPPVGGQVLASADWRAGVGAFCSINRSCLSSVQNAAGTAACIEFQSS